jgi:hypothetical protein
VGQKVRLPPELRAALSRLFGATPELEEVQIIEHSLFALLHGARATTRRNRIYLRGSAASFFADHALVLHEYCHVLRQWAPRELTSWRYVSEWLRRGYWDNRFEIEAREFAEDHLHRFRAQLSQYRLAHVESTGEPGERDA